MTSTPSFKLLVTDAMSKLDATSWNACANPPTQSYNPFLDYNFLKALEESGSAIAETGWEAQHFTLKFADGMDNQANGDYAAVMPLYLKSHSQGEYVFDHGWAEAFQRAGGRYYPKLLSAIPFIPASGRRLLTHPSSTNETDEAQAKLALITGLKELTEKLNLSSCHINFCAEDEWDLLGKHGFLKRSDQQFHWLNNGYSSFDDFLSALSSRKRKNLKKERQKAVENNIKIECLTGSDLTETHWDAFYSFYMDTSSRKWGQPYLTRKFFSLISDTMPDKTLLILAKREGNPIAGALNFIGGDTLYGRNWGCLEDHPFLHFECCYYQAIDFAIAKGLKRVEAGAQGPHKLARGYVPSRIQSAHYIPHQGFRQAVENYLEQERQHVENDMQVMVDNTPFKKSS